MLIFDSDVKQFVTTILIILLAFQSFYPLAIYTYYYANKTYIATVLCENRYKPQLHCDGKCFLAKKLKKAEEEGNKDKAAVTTVEAFVYIATPAFREADIHYTDYARNYPAHQPDHYTFEYYSPCFHPPCSALVS